MRSAERFGVLLTIALVAGVAAGAATSGEQSGEAFHLAVPQAKSDDEFALYLEIDDEPEPAAKIQKAKQFRKAFPDSELLGWVHRHEVFAYQVLNDLDGMLDAGAQAIVVMPNDWATMLELASAIPNGTAGRTDAAALLGRAETYARQALLLLADAKISRRISFEEWTKLRADMEGQAHEALGHVAAKRGRLGLAIEEFEEAVRSSAVPKGRQYFRLAAAYAEANRKEEARVAFQRAIELGPDSLALLARKELEMLTEASGEPQRDR